MICELNDKYWIFNLPSWARSWAMGQQSVAHKETRSELPVKNEGKWLVSSLFVVCQAVSHQTRSHTTHAALYYSKIRTTTDTVYSTRRYPWCGCFENAKAANSFSARTAPLNRLPVFHPPTTRTHLSISGPCSLPPLDHVGGYIVTCHYRPRPCEYHLDYRFLVQNNKGVAVRWRFFGGPWRRWFVGVRRPPLIKISIHIFSPLLYLSLFFLLSPIFLQKSGPRHYGDCKPSRSTLFKVFSLLLIN